MRILYLTHSAGIQGSGIALLNIFKGFINTNIIPIVILPAKGDMYNELNKLGIKCYVIPYYMDIYPFLDNFRDYVYFFPRLLRYIIYRVLAICRIKVILKNEKIDLIHTNTGVIHFGALIAKQVGLPHVWHIREMQDLGLGYRPIVSMSLFRKQCSDINNCCIAITKSVFEYHNLRFSKDFVIYDGVFPEKVCTESIIKEKDNYFLFVGTLTERKGVLDAIHAFEKLADEYPQIELWLVGKETIIVKEALRLSNYKSRIKLLGFRRDVYKLMKYAKALLVPSYHEGFGFITAEAMINGCLVIGRDTAGTKEQFDNGVLYKEVEIGLRFKTQEELENQMRYVCRVSVNELMPQLLAAKEVARNYTIENNIKEITKLYNKIVNK